MRKRIIVFGVLVAIGMSTLGFVFTQPESREPETATVRVLVPVNQAHGEMVAAALGGQPIMDCGQLINLFGLYINVGSANGTVPCDLVVELDP